jgi:hypothetical protein
MVEDIFKDIIPKNVKIKTLTVTREGILVSGEIGLLEITE